MFQEIAAIQRSRQTQPVSATTLPSSPRFVRFGSDSEQVDTFSPEPPRRTTSGLSLPGSNNLSVKVKSKGKKDEPAEVTADQVYNDLMRDKNKDFRESMSAALPALEETELSLATPSESYQKLLKEQIAKNRELFHQNFSDYPKKNHPAAKDALVRFCIEDLKQSNPGLNDAAITEYKRLFETVLSPEQVKPLPKRKRKGVPGNETIPASEAAAVTTMLAEPPPATATPPVPTVKKPKRKKQEVSGGGTISFGAPTATTSLPVPESIANRATSIAASTSTLGTSGLNIANKPRFTNGQADFVQQLAPKDLAHESYAGWEDMLQYINKRKGPGSHTSSVDYNEQRQTWLGMLNEEKQGASMGKQGSLNAVQSVIRRRMKH